MKKVFLVCMLIAALAHSVNAAEKTRPPDQKVFLLTSIHAGISSPVGMKNDFTEPVGFISGASIKYIYDDPEYPAVAAGITYFSSVFNDDDLTPGSATNRITGQTLDLMVALKRTYSYITYLSFCAGKGKEKFNMTNMTGPSVRSDVSTALYGIGFGAFEKPWPRRRLIFGSELRYLSAPELEDISGLFQVIISVGYAF